MPIRCTMCVVQCVPLPICPDCDRKSIKCTHNVSSYIRTYIYTYIHRTPCSVCSEQTCAWIITRNNPVKSRVLIINEYCPGKWLLLLLLPLLLYYCYCYRYCCYCDGCVAISCHVTIELSVLRNAAIVVEVGIVEIASARSSLVLRNHYAVLASLYTAIIQ